MEGRRMSTRSSRRATALPVSPIKQAVMANVMGAGKATAKRSTRKVLADKTNGTLAERVPTKSPKKSPAAVTSQAQEEASTPSQKKRPLEELKGEDLLRSLVHNNLSTIQTPNGLSSQSPQYETPHFGVPESPKYQNKHDDPEAVAEVSTPSSEQAEPEVVDARPNEPSPQNDVPNVAERLSSAWVRRDVDEVTEAGEDDDSDCSVLVNVSSPAVTVNIAASPALATIRPSTPEAADFKWQRRESQKVKESEEECGFNYYDVEDAGYEEFDDYDEDLGQVIDCDEICEGISRIQVADKGLPEPKGRHIRFNYNSDGEIEEEEVDVMRLRGLPTPMGKHLRFPEDKEGSSP